MISTVAGGPAFALGAVTWVEFDPAGALFLADRVGSRIWKLNPTGSLSLVAGTGTVGFSGDGGPAIEAELDEPAGFTFDRAGSLFIAEAGNHRVRKVDRAGVITTVAGTGVEGSAGDGGPATQAQLDVPNRLLFDRAGNLLIDNYGSGRVRSVSPNGIITTIASGLKGPHGLALDASGRLYIAEYDGSRILRLEKDGRLVVIAGTGGHGFAGDAGPATKATLNGPRGVTIDSAGNVYIADDDNNRLRKIPSGANTA
ncbi:MAG: hypothetical protein ABI334_09615 [Candidatus Dormiibacterota bacterium]